MSIQTRRSITFLNLLLFASLIGSCTNKAQDSRSPLIERINAVQEQIMAQGNVTEEEEQALLGLCNIVSINDGLAKHDPQDRMILRDVDFAPVYAGCENLSKEETMDCFTMQISSFIKEEFDLELSKALNLSEPKVVDVFFLIDESGNVTGMKVRNTDVSIQGEILRVLRKIPAMSPAIHQGENTSVLCSMVFQYGNELNVKFAYIPEFPAN